MRAETSAPARATHAPRNAAGSRWRFLLLLAAMSINLTVLSAWIIAVWMPAPTQTTITNADYNSHIFVRELKKYELFGPWLAMTVRETTTQGPGYRANEARLRIRDPFKEPIVYRVSKVRSGLPFQCMYSARITGSAATSHPATMIWSQREPGNVWRLVDGSNAVPCMIDPLPFLANVGCWMVLLSVTRLPRALRTRSRVKSGQCLHCGYLLTGLRRNNHEVICPECGIMNEATDTDQPTRLARWRRGIAPTLSIVIAAALIGYGLGQRSRFVSDIEKMAALHNAVEYLIPGEYGDTNVVFEFEGKNDAALRNRLAEIARTRNLIKEAKEPFLALEFDAIMNELRERNWRR